jgi:hypothetical protein
MGEPAGQHVWHFRYGESHDDLRTAFYVDERAYPNAAAARAATDSARNALRRLGVIFDSELLPAEDYPESPAQPSWEEFKQRHFVEGQPVRVRAGPLEAAVPPVWQAMHEEMRRANDQFRGELLRLLESAFPGSRSVVDHDRGPLRRSAGSVDLSEEKHGFEIEVSADVGDIPVGEATDRIAKALWEAGWEPADPGDSAVKVTRDRFQIGVDVEPGSVFLLGQSPLYSAPPAPADSWITEPRW